MSDADLIYNALLRAERRMEEAVENAPYGDRTIVQAHMASARFALQTIREEVGNGLAKEGR